MKTFLVILSVSAIGMLFSLKQPQPSVPDLSKGKVVIQMNYEWNKTNDYQWKTINGVKYYFLSLDKFPELKTRMKIKTVPTIVVLNNGQEIKRVEGGMLMKINNSQNEIIQLKNFLSICFLLAKVLLTKEYLVLLDLYR